MSERKIISINPELFNMNNTRKNKKTDGKPLKIKEQNNNKNNKTTKGKLLRYIREQQEENYRKIFEDNKKNNENVLEPIKISLDETTDKDFEDSLNFLNNKLKEENIAKNSHNNTMKNYRQNDKEFFNPYFNNASNDYKVQTTSSLMHPGSNVLQPVSNILLKPSFQNIQNQRPVFGCLKNGILPTYRNYVNQTRKNMGFQPRINISGVQQNQQNLYQQQSQQSHQSQQQNQQNQQQSQPQQQNQQNPIQPDILNLNNLNNLSDNEKLKNISELRQIRQLIDKSKSIVPNNLKYSKRKKTVKRTFYVGKSKKFPKISVLVSNKTIRKNVTTQTHLLKQESIHNIKKFLIKKGFIKVGSTAPNDVLRKMYESIMLVGGEIKNHNPDNLLYNYLHE